MKRLAILAAAVVLGGAILGGHFSNGGRQGRSLTPDGSRTPPLTKPTGVGGFSITLGR